MTAPSPPPSLLSAGELEKLEELQRANPIIAFENYGDGRLAVSAGKWPYIKAALDALPALLAAYRAQEAKLADLRAQVGRQAEAIKAVVSHTHRPNPTDPKRIDVAPGHHRMFQAAIEHAVAVTEPRKDDGAGE